MVRPGQKSLNMWIPEEIHRDIKDKASRHGMNIKEYIIALHKNQIHTSKINSNNPPDTKPNAEYNTIVHKLEMIEKLNKQILNKISNNPQPIQKTVPRRTSKQPIKYPNTKQTHRIVLEEEKLMGRLNDKLESYLHNIKLRTPKTNTKKLRGIIMAILDGNTTNYEILNYVCGNFFPNERCKSIRRPMNTLLEDKIISRSRSKSKTYSIEINPEYLN